MKASILKSIGALALVAIAVPATAAPYTLGNIFVSTGSGTVQEYTPTGTLVQTLTGGTSFMTGSAFDAAGNFYVTNFGGNTVRKYDPSGTSPGTTFGGGYSTPEMIVVDGAGDFYVGNISGGILKFDSTGAPLASYITSTRIDFMDLAADQTTMLYTQEGGEIHAVNVGTGVGLADFSTDVENAFALRILSNGNVLVADGSDIELLDVAGIQIGSYDITGAGTWFALNIDESGTSFWSATTNGLVAEFDIATGTVLNQWNTVSGDAWGLAVFGEVTQGCTTCGGGGAGASNVPLASTLTLLSLGFVGLGRRRGRMVVKG